MSRCGEVENSKWNWVALAEGAVISRDGFGAVSTALIEDRQAPTLCSDGVRRQMSNELLHSAGMTTSNGIVLTLRAVLPDLRAEWPIRSLALFGSRVRDDATAGSDLDVLVEFARPVSLSAFLALEERLAGITGLRIDLVSVDALKPRIGERVRAEAIFV